MNTSKSSTPIIQLYFVMSSLLGLGLTALGVSMLVNVALSQTILKVPQYPSMPPMAPTMIKLEQPEGLAADDQAAWEQWKVEYQHWQEVEKNYDYEAATQRRQLITAISLLVTGLPILGFHAPWVFRKK